MAATSYVVIGSNCFTGSHMVDALLGDPDRRVIGVSRSAEYKDLFLPYKHHHHRPGCEFHQIDVVHHFDDLAALLDRVQPQVVINVAALSEVALSNFRPREYFDTNTTAVVRLCEHLRARSYLQWYVHVSSAEIFGSCAAPVAETHGFCPSTPYAVSKAAADSYVGLLIKNFDFPGIVIRSTNVYGRHQQLYKIIPRAVIYVKQGRTIELHGGGRAVKSFVHVRDVVRGTLLAVDHGVSGAYHFTDGSERTVADVVRMICGLLGRDADSSTRVVEERLGQDARYWLDCSKAERELGWRPEIPLGDGLRDVVSWIEENWEEIATEPHEYVHQVAQNGFSGGGRREPGESREDTGAVDRSGMPGGSRALSSRPEGEGLEDTGFSTVAAGPS